MLRTFYRHLRVQMLAASLLPVLLLSAAVSASTIALQHDQLLEQAQARARQAGQTADAIFDERLAFARLLAGLLADRPVLVRGFQTLDQAELAAFVQQTRSDTLFDLVTIIDAHGAVLAQDGNPRLWRSTSAPPSPRTFWAVPQFGMVVQVTHPIDGSLQPEGWLVGSFVMDNTFAADVRDQTDLDQSILFGSALVATSQPQRAAQSDTFLDPSLSAQVLQQGQTADVETSVGATPYLAHYTPLEVDGRVLGAIEVLLPLVLVQNAQAAAMRAVLLSTAAAIAGALVLGWLLTRQITEPVGALVRAARAIGQGNLGVSVTPHGPAEVQQLGAAVEQMRHNLARSQSALQAEKARYANIVESVEEGVITLDGQAHVTALNRSAAMLLDVDRAQAVGRPLDEVIRLRQHASLRLSDLPPFGATRLAIRTPNGGERTVAATRSQLAGATQLTVDEHVLVLRDISEEAEVGQLKDAFLANVTHEFRTPLAALIASIEILRDEREPLTSAERAPMLTAIHLGVQRLDTLIQNLLDSASLQAGYFRVEPDVTALQPLIDEAVQLMAPLLQKRGQGIVVQQPQVAPPVLADDRRIVQVLVNLLSNASKFGPHGDQIQLAVTAQEDTVRISVTDHGPGIAPPHEARLFERFLRPGPTTVQAQGAGLGLAIVKAIVERHGGRVTVESNTRTGTTFAVELRRAPQADKFRQKATTPVAGVFQDTL
jgi:PAS domain S-box-containing protein